LSEEFRLSGDQPHRLLFQMEHAHIHPTGPHSCKYGQGADHSQPRWGVLLDPKGLNDGLTVYFTEQIAEAHIRTIGEKPHICE